MCRLTWDVYENLFPFTHPIACGDPGIDGTAEQTTRGARSYRLIQSRLVGGAVESRSSLPTRLRSWEG